MQRDCDEIMPYRNVTALAFFWVVFVSIVIIGLAEKAGAVDLRNHIRFERMDIYDQLSQNTINAMLVDQLGFFWFGTQDGLNRFDAYNFEVFKNETNNPNSISANWITSLAEDHHGNIWVGTFGGGLNHYNIYNGKISRVRTKSGIGISDNDVNTLFVDSSGNLWIGLQNEGLFLLPADSIKRNYNEEITGFKKVISTGVSGEEVRDFRVRDILEADDKSIWIATFREGIIIKDQNGETIRQLTTENCKLPSNNISAFYLDEDKMLWVGADNKGVTILDMATCAKPAQGYIYNHYVLEKASINVIFQDSFKRLWIGSDDEGLLLIDRKTDEIYLYKHHTKNRSSLGTNTVYTIMEDDNQTLWFGTYLGGISKVDPRAGGFINFAEESGTSSSLSYGIVRAVIEDNAQKIWIGTRGGGLNIYDIQQDKMQVLRHSPNDRYSISDNNVNAILKIDDNNFWIATLNGLNRYDAAANRFYRINSDSYGNRLRDERIRMIYRDSRNLLWIAVGQIDAAALYILDLNTNRLHSFAANTDYLNSLINNTINYFLEDDEGRVWIGTYGGLSIAEVKYAQGNINLTYEHHIHDAENPGSIGNNIVSSIYKDDNGQIWLSTYGAGLNKAITENGKLHFELINEDFGISTNAIFGVIADSDGRIWLSTNRGLTSYDPETGFIRNFDVMDGISSMQFSQGAFHRGASGRLYFGGINGLTTFLPEHIQQNDRVPPVIITSFKKFEQEVALDTLIYYKREIVIDYKENFFSFEFTALNYTASERNEYAYMLEGFDKDWIYAGNRRYASYTNINPGEYVFRVKASNNDGVWNEEGVSLAVIINPPFYMTWWFYTLCVLFVLGIITFWNLRERRLKKVLEKTVEERTIELRKSEKLFRLMGESAGDMVIVLDGRSVVVYINPAVEKVLGYRKRDVVGKNIFRFIHKEDQDIAFSMAASMLDTGETQNYDVRTISKEGELRYVHVSASVMKGQSKDAAMYLMVCHDLTERILFENELKSSKEAAEAANIAKSVFLANMSHELRTPLNAILGYSQILINDEQTPKKQRGHVDTLYRSGLHLLSMINDVLDLSKIEAGRMDVYNISFMLLEFLNDVQTMFKISSDHKGIQFDLKTDKDLPVRVIADNAKLRQVLINLVSNAVKFTDQGGVSLRVQKTSQPDKKDLKKANELFAEELEEFSELIWLEFSVKDTGIGISKEELDLVFNPFQQAKGQMRGGTGLGLSISNRIVTLMGGNLEALSQPGKGSEFSFTLPLIVDTKNKNVISKSGKRIYKIRPEQNKKILIVDDIDTNRDVVSELLKQIGFECYEAEDGFEAVEMYKKIKPDLILMDHIMPQRTGLETFRTIRKLESNGEQVPMIMITASGFDNDEKSMLEAGFADYIRKPFKDEQLFLSISRVLDLQYDVEEKKDENNENLSHLHAIAENLRMLENMELREFHEAVELLDMDEIISVIEKLNLDADQKKRINDAVAKSDFRFFITLGELLDQ